MYLPQKLKHPLPVKSLHTTSWACSPLLSQLPSQFNKFLDSYHPFSTPVDKDVHDMSVHLSGSKSSHFCTNIIARNAYNVDPIRARYTFVLDSGANRHMCHDKALFIKMCAYTGTIQHTTLGNGKTTTPICRIGTI